MIDSSALSHFLFQCISNRVTAPVRHQIEALKHNVQTQWDERAFREGFTTAARRLGHDVIYLTKEETAELKRFGVVWPLCETLDELVRIAMLTIAAMHLPDFTFRSLLQRCYEDGDSRERCAILRALPLLPTDERFVDMAVDACRSHIKQIFEAVACENPYPAEHFPELHFNQTVLKALFTGTALSRILGLEGRVTPELMRMADDYASECRAADRSIPVDIGRLVGQAE